MALTMTRTQTALTKLVGLVANVHGELELVERLLAEGAGDIEALATRMQQLEVRRNALHATMTQFDPSSDPADIANTRG